MTNQDTTKYPLLKDDVAKKILKNKKIGKEYMARIVSNILEEDYQTIYNNLKFISEDISFSSKTTNSRADVVLDEDSILIIFEVNYFNGPNRKAQMTSYMCQLYLGQLANYQDYQNVHRIVHIIIEDQDYFHKNDLVYHVVFMDRKYHIEDEDKIERFRINLDFLSKMTYPDIRKSELARLLYLFVCGDDELKTIDESLYYDDEFMKEVVNVARKISQKGAFKLYFPLSDEEIRRLDEEYFRKQGIEKGYAEGREQGIKQGIKEGILKNQREMIVEMNSHGVSVDVIAMCTHLSIEEVLTIIKNSEI